MLVINNYQRQNLPISGLIYKRTHKWFGSDHDIPIISNTIYETFVSSLLQTSC